MQRACHSSLLELLDDSYHGDAGGHTGLDEIHDAGENGHVVSSGQHCKQPEPGFVFIHNSCAASVQLAMQVGTANLSFIKCGSLCPSMLAVT